MTDALLHAAAAIDAAQSVVDAAVARLAEHGIDDNQVVAYDVAHDAAAVQASRGLLGYGAKGDIEERLTGAFVADAIGELAALLYGREREWGVEVGALDQARAFVGAH